MNKGIERYRDDLMNVNVEGGYAEIEAAITAMLNKFSDMGLNLRVLLENFDNAADQGYTYECLIRPYTYNNFQKLNVVIDNGTGRGELTSQTLLGVPAGAPFTGYKISDVVQLSNFNNPDVNGVTADGRYTVYAIDDVLMNPVGATARREMTFTTVLTGLNNTADLTGTVRITERP